MLFRSLPAGGRWVSSALPAPCYTSSPPPDRVAEEAWSVMRRNLLALMVVAGLVVAGCSGDDEGVVEGESSSDDGGEVAAEGEGWAALEVHAGGVEGVRRVICLVRLFTYKKTNKTF